jgi:hypothetical protein
VSKFLRDLGEYRQVLTYFVAISSFPVFFYILFSKGLWGFEEASHYFPLEALSTLQNQKYLFGTNVVSGNSANMLPLGFIFGVLQTFVSNAMLPFWITSALAIMLMLSLFIFSGIFLKSILLRLLFVLSVTFSFVFLHTVLYLSKTSGVIFFLLMVVISTRKISAKWKLLATSGVSFLTLGVCSNLAIFVLGHLYIFFVICVFPKQTLREKKRITFLVLQSLTALLVQSPVLWLIYLRNGELSGYSDFAKETNYHFGASKNFLNGEGYWMQFESFGDIPYFNFMPNFGSLYYDVHFWSMLLVLLVPIGYWLCGYITGSGKLIEMARTCSRAQKENRNILRILGILGLIIFLNFESNPLALAMKNLVPLRAFREPWTKFEIYFYIFLVLWTFIVLEKIFFASILYLKMRRKPIVNVKNHAEKKVIKKDLINGIGIDRSRTFLKAGLIATILIYSTYYAQFPLAVLSNTLTKSQNYSYFPLIAPGNSLQPLIESVEEVGQAWSDSDSTKPMIICNISGNAGVGRIADSFLPFIVDSQPNFIKSETQSSVKSNQQVFDCGAGGAKLDQNRPVECSPVFRNLDFYIVSKDCLFADFQPLLELENK